MDLELIGSLVVLAAVFVYALRNTWAIRHDIRDAFTHRS